MYLVYDSVVQYLVSSAGAFCGPVIQYAIYLKNGNQCNLKLNLLKGKYHFEWISTMDGSLLKSGELKCRSGEVVLESPPYRDDIALKIIRN